MTEITAVNHMAAPRASRIQAAVAKTAYGCDCSTQTSGQVRVAAQATDPYAKVGKKVLGPMPQRLSLFSM